MRDSLFLYLRQPAPDGRWPCAVVDRDGGLPQVQAADAGELAELAAGRRVVCFVPTSEVRLTTVSLPARQPQKVLQAAPYALEEQFAEEVETLHFAIGQRMDDGAFPVAVVSHARMQQWLSLVPGLKLDAVVPDALALPRPGARWTALVDANRITVRTGACGAFTCTPQDLPFHLGLADPDGAQGLEMHVPKDVTHDFSTIDRPLELLPGAGSAIEVLIQHWRADSAIDLLQGAYSQREDWRRKLQPWRAVAALAALVVGLSLAHDAIQAWRLGAATESQRARNAERFEAAFPGQRATADLARQIASLQQQGGTGDEDTLFELLDVLAQSLRDNATLELRGFQYREQSLFLSLRGPDAQALENLRAWYASRPSAALEVQGVNANDEGVQIRVKLGRAT